MDDITKAFKQALEFEQKGYDIYKTASNSKNSVVARTFSYLAEQEQLHIDEIKKYLEMQNIEFKGDTKKETGKFFNTTVKGFKQKTSLSNNDVKAHELGLKLERDSYNFYEKQYNKTADPKLKKFFKFLMDQESAHYDLIEKSYKFVKNPEAFYAEHEDWFFEG